MGYIVTGYPSRHDKRKKHVLPLHQFAASPLNLQRYLHLFQAPAFSKRSRSDESNHAKVQVKKLRLSPKLTLQDLPVEIIQHIFVFTKGEPAMIALNKFFYKCLKPSFSLLSKIMWEKYLFSPLEFGVENIKTDSGYVVIPTLFEHETFFRLLLDHHHILLQNISHFLPTKHFQDMQNGDFDTSVELDLCSLTTKDANKEDFPRNFYNNMQIYLTHRDSIRSMSNYFTLKNPYDVISPFIEWVFQAIEMEGDEITSEFTVDNMFESIDLILYISGSAVPKFTSTEPLLTVVFLLYFTHVNFLHTSNFDIFFQHRSRLQFMEDFISKYYYDSSLVEHELLSDAAVWDLLRRVSDLKLIDLVVKCGGRPQYGVMFS